MDWHDSTLISTFDFDMLSPFSFTKVGSLDGAILSDSSITYAYYTDSRVGGSLKVIDSNYIDNTLIRITHHIASENYTRTLGTFYVTNDDLSYQHGTYTGTMELHSMIYSMNDDYHRDCFTIGAKTYSKSVLRGIFEAEGLKYEILSSCPDHRYSDTKVYDYGQNILSTVFDQTSLMGARLDVDGDGTITVKPYAAPSSRTPVFDFDYTADDSVMVGAVKVTSDRYRTVSGVGVHYKGKNASGKKDVEYFASSDISSSSPASFGRRGRRIIKTYDLSDMNPPTNAQARTLAKRYLDDNDDESLEYEFDGLYIGDLTEGSVVRLTLDGRNWRKCLVKTMDVSLKPGMTTKYTLKAV